MEAKDTVMKIGGSERLLVANSLDAIKDICLIQAEISFKAGIKEVAEWVEANSYRYTHRTLFWTDRWQSKLREWGISP